MAEHEDDRRRESPPSEGVSKDSRAPLTMLADAVARIKVSVQVKLLSGYLVVALLVLVMAALSLVVISSMNNQVGELTRLQDQVESVALKNNLLTSQLHSRALGLLTDDMVITAEIARVKTRFSEELAHAELKSPASKSELFQRVREANDRFTAAGLTVTALQQTGDLDEAVRAHVDDERRLSFEVEQLMGELVADAERQMHTAQAAFQSDRRLLTTVAWTFSGASLAAAILIGLSLSFAFIRPVRRIDRALAQIAVGDFDQRVVVPNRDEFGTLSVNLNRTTERLGDLYGELQSLNQDLQTRVDEQVTELERTNRMRRYLSPQVAESILAGTTDVDLTSRRQNLTVLFSDIRGFTAMSERLEPEELVDMLNEYLTEMTEIVFRHGGTLDKYIGDAIMVFYGDPVPYEDHAERAVRTALDMRSKLVELQRRWTTQKREELLTMGTGITTGYVTVGNIGAPSRLDYTVLGNQVNLASRLSDRAEGGQILVSERTLVAVDTLVTSTEIDRVELDGVSREIRIFAVDEKQT